MKEKTTAALISALESLLIQINKMFPKTQTDKDLMLVAGHMENCIIQWDGRRFSIWGYDKIVDMNNNKITPTDEALRKIQAGLDIINKKLFMIKESKSGNQ